MTPTTTRRRTPPGRPKIALVETGGTMLSIGVDRLDHVAYGESGLRMALSELIDAVPEVNEIADIAPSSFPLGGSLACTADGWIGLVREIEQILTNVSVQGVVVVHGTNTLEETAFFLHLLLDDPRPVVVVGSMRPLNTLSSDATLGLLNAVRVSVDPKARHRGVLVCMNGLILSARDSVKSSTHAVEAFQARDAGPLGFTTADGNNAWCTPVPSSTPLRKKMSVGERTDLPRVDAVMSYVGADGALIDAAVDAGARGIVSAGTGAGRVTPAEDESLRRAAMASVVVCQATRVHSGFVTPTPRTLRLGFVAAGNLPPWKARVLLSVALVSTQSPHEVQSVFDNC